MPDVPPIPLAQLTTLRTGGMPDRMIEAHTTDELVDALR
ncbi:MAG TPA: UDP-N-acetylenolpyruvoylglucosamine reductase, partial [Microbacterium sp.]|nr:UDP-N-acetylenolpyruvoylglucosamine reductase [Microbacterium sp.]